MRRDGELGECGVSTEQSNRARLARRSLKFGKLKSLKLVLVGPLKLPCKSKLKP